MCLKSGGGGFTKAVVGLIRESGVLAQARDVAVLLGELDCTFACLFEVTGRVCGQHRGLEAQFVDRRDAGLIKPIAQVGGLVIYPERRGDTGCVHTGGEGQVACLFFSSP